MPHKPLRVGVNGCGRIGRTLLRLLTGVEYPGVNNSLIDLVVAHDLMPAEQLVYLLNNDSVHGRLECPFIYDATTHHITRLGWSFVYKESKHPQVPLWSDYGIHTLVETSAAYRTKEALQLHLDAGVDNILLAAPLLLEDSSIDPNSWTKQVHGLMPGEFEPHATARIYPTFSCTTQAMLTVLAPLLASTNPIHAKSHLDGESALDTATTLDIESMMVTELHGYTTSQSLLDGPHRDWRRGRAAASSIIPTMTQGIFGVEQFFPHLHGKVSGYSARVPVNNVAAVDINIVLKKPVDLDAIIEKLTINSTSYLLGRLAIDRQPLVSVDYIGRTESAIVAADLCQTIGRQLRLFAWYDNETGYSSRLIESLINQSLLNQ